jgi:transketolase
VNLDINKLKKRVLEISYKHKLSHIGSSLTALPIICEIYEQKKKDDIFILSSGHAGLALYVVLESLGLGNAEEMLTNHGIHPSRDKNIFCSTGSLGTGITIGVGAAFASPNKTIYVLCSDGETYEGSFWESLCFIYSHELTNCKIFVNINGFSAYQQVDVFYLTKRLYSFLPSISIFFTNVAQYPFLKNVSAHYHVMSEIDYQLTI